MSEPEHPLRDIFAEALEITDLNHRSAFLDRRCGQDSVLRQEAEKLLQAAAQAGRFLPDQPAALAAHAAVERLVEKFDKAGGWPESPLAEEPGDCIGRYRLLERIGEGGCGVVYLASQGEPVRRQVALKIVKLGMDTRQVIARFEGERQALAMMDHPNIAKVFDAGVAGHCDGFQGRDHAGQIADWGGETMAARNCSSGVSGRPYFVMELVRGSKITDYCDRQHLCTRARLELFIQVCQAVQHAHQKGVIHRDLKPSNILVAVDEGVAIPKVIDFGIAKATQGKLTDETVFTAVDQFLGTPAYMSPEQAAITSLDVDTRSDIYSLGVLLYELLTGTTPFEAKALLTLGVDELRRTIREEEPERPSCRLRTLHGRASQERASQRQNPGSRIDPDLDWIVMKCLEKDPARRYATAHGLAVDLKRHLDHELVSARPPSRLYEFRKAVLRHKTGFAAVAAVIVTLIAGVIASSSQTARAIRAEREQNRLRLQAKAEAYASDMTLCYQEWLEGKLRNARARLNAHLPEPGQPDRRSFEWRYLWNLCQDESVRTVKFEASDRLRQLAGTPAHHFIAAACDKTIRLLEPSTAREVARLPYPHIAPGPGWPRIALAAQMTNVLAAHRDGGVIGLWDLASRRLMAAFRPFTNNVGVLALSPNGVYLAVADQEGPGFYSTAVAVWDVSFRRDAPQLAWSQPVEGGISALTFSPNGEVVAAARSSGGISVESWDVKTGRALGSIPDAAAANIQTLCFSPDGTLLASSGAEGRINLWHLRSQTLKQSFPGHSAVESLVFSADGERLFSGGGDGTIRCWDLRANTSAGLWRLPRGGEISLTVAPDGKSVWSAAHSEVRVWDPEPREPATLIRVRPGWSWPAIAPDGTKLIVADPDDLNGSNGAAVWDLASGQHLLDLVPKGMVAKSFAFSPDGRLMAASSLWKDGVVGIWETAAWKKGASRLAPFAYVTNGFECASLCFSPDGRILAAAGLSFPPYAPKEPSGATNRLAFWVVGSWKRLNLLLDAGVGATEWAAAASVDFSNDGRLVAVGSRDGCVSLWDLRAERLLRQSREFADDDHWGVVVKFSPDSRWLAAFHMGSPGTKLWDLTEPHHPAGHWLGVDETAGVHGALFTHDSRSFVAASNDGLIKFWNLQTRLATLTLRHGHGPGGFLAMAPDGTFLVSKDAGAIVKIWKAPLLTEIDQKQSSR